MFFHPEMAAKIAEPRRGDLIAEADAYRLAQRRGSRANRRPGRLGRVAQPLQPAAGLFARVSPARLPHPGSCPRRRCKAEIGPALGSADLVGRRQLEKAVSWTGPERLRCLWYRLRLTIAEMNYATRRMAEQQMRLP
jgi:hypothetical protein